ncbi:hypothetical protein BH11BAC7_BH11BAC7_09890 [soil metagenome]
MAFQEYILLVVFLLYVIYTFLFALRFRNASTIYTQKQKQLHSILIWLIPFFWIILLKSFSKSTPGSHYYPNKKGDHGFYESGAGSWGDSSGSDSGGHH